MIWLRSLDRLSGEPRDCVSGANRTCLGGVSLCMGIGTRCRLPVLLVFSGVSVPVIVAPSGVLEPESIDGESLLGQSLSSGSRMTMSLRSWSTSLVPSRAGSMLDRSLMSGTS